MNKLYKLFINLENIVISLISKYLIKFIGFFYNFNYFKPNKLANSFRKNLVY